MIRRKKGFYLTIVLKGKLMMYCPNVIFNVPVLLIVPWTLLKGNTASKLAFHLKTVSHNKCDLTTSQCIFSSSQVRCMSDSYPEILRHFRPTSAENFFPKESTSRWKLFLNVHCQGSNYIPHNGKALLDYSDCVL